MIHPGGDTTTDSGSIYTLPPDFGGLEMSCRNVAPMAPNSVEKQAPRQDCGSSDGMSECEPHSDREASPKPPNSTSLVTTSSEGAQLLSSKVNEKSRRTSASTGASHSFEDEDDDEEEEEEGGSCRSGEASALISSQRPAVPPRWQGSPNGKCDQHAASRQRKRSKRRQRPATSSTTVTREQTPSQPTRRLTQAVMLDSIQHSGADSGLGSSRADVPPNLRGGRPLQQFVQQPFSTNGELLGQFPTLMQLFQTLSCYFRFLIFLSCACYRYRICQCFPV